MFLDYVCQRDNHPPRAEYLKKKTIVFGMVQRKGNVMTKVVPNAKSTTLTPIIEKNVYKLSKLHTDESKSYTKISHSGSLHDTVNHSAKEYVRGKPTPTASKGFGPRLREASKVPMFTSLASIFKSIWLNLNFATTCATPRGLCSAAF